MSISKTTKKMMKKKPSRCSRCKKKNICTCILYKKPKVCSNYKDFGVCEEYAEKHTCVLRHPVIEISRTLFLPDLYQRSLHLDFEEFHEKLYTKLSQYGEVFDLIVLDYVPENMYMAGHAFVTYRKKKQAAVALENLRGSFHDGVPVTVTFSPVKNLRSHLCPGYERLNVCCLHPLDLTCILKHIKKTRRAYYPTNKNMMKTQLVVDDGDVSPPVHKSGPDSCIQSTNQGSSPMSTDQDSCIITE